MSSADNSTRGFAVELEADTELRGDRYLATIKGLGAAGYGATVVEAQACANFVAERLVRELMNYGGEEAVKRRLRRAGIDESAFSTPAEGQWKTTIRFTDEGLKREVTAG